MTRGRKTGGSVAVEKKLVDHKGESRFWDVLDGLCEIQCNSNEICAVMDATWDELDAACRRNFKMGFGAYQAMKGDGGKASLRRMQWQSAKDGNVSMQIWLGKNILKQSDTFSISQEINVDRDVQIAREAVEKNPGLIDAIFNNKKENTEANKSASIQ